MDSNALFSAVVEHKWLAVATLFIGLFVRLLKDDNGFPMTLPAVITIWSWVPIVGGRSFESKRVKPWIAVGLGLLYGALEKVAAGTSWKQALSDAAIAGLLPIVGHQLGIESIRDGKEVTVKLPDGGSGSGPSMMTFAFAALAGFLMLASCSASQKKVERIVVDKGTEACLALDPGNPFCTAIENFEPFIPFIQDLAGKRESDAKNGKVGGAKHSVTCTVSP